MQDVTDLAFMEVMHRYGDPDLYVTEYFRVYPGSHPDKHILRSIDENKTGRPIAAQMIGQDIPDLVRTAEILQRHAICAIDLNLGCPAPVVCRKDAGGGLLRHPERIDQILGALRDAVHTKLTVKTRLGFENPGEFDRLLDVFARHAIDALTVHGRTVKEMYRTAVHYDWIAEAAARMVCPVFANGNVLSVRLADETLRLTKTSGLMIGRGAIRNPWIFRQIREAWTNQPVFVPTFRDLRAYIRALWDATNAPNRRPEKQVARIKKFMNFIGQGVDPGEQFLFAVRRSETAEEFWRACDTWLDRDGILPAEPASAALICPRSERLTAA